MATQYAKEYLEKESLSAGHLGPISVERIGELYLGFAGIAAGMSDGIVAAAQEQFRAMSKKDKVNEILNLQEKFPLHCTIQAIIVGIEKAKGEGTPPPSPDGIGVQGVEGEVEGGDKDEPKKGEPKDMGGQQEVEKKSADLAEMLKETLNAIATKDERNTKVVMDFVEEQIKEKMKGVKIEGGAPRKCVIEIVRPDREKKDLKAIVHPNFPIVLALAEARIPCYMVGPAGSGKSTIAKQVSETLELPYHPMSFNSMMGYSSVFGFVPVTGDGYQGTPFRDAYENGGVCLWDEMDAANANIITAANMATSNGVCPFPDRMVEQHENFILLAGANTYGKGASRSYVGRNALDSATLDRFAFVELDYDKEFEASILTGENTVVPVEVYTEKGKRGSKTFDKIKWLERVRKIRETIEKLDIRVVMSPRVSLYGATMLGMGIKQEVVEDTLIWWKLDDKTRGRVKTAVS